MYQLCALLKRVADRGSVLSMSVSACNPDCSFARFMQSLWWCSVCMEDMLTRQILAGEGVSFTAWQEATMRIDSGSRALRSRFLIFGLLF